MILLNKESILEYRKQHMLDIEDMNIELLHPTFYYFRLGKLVRIWDENKRDYILLDLTELTRKVLSVPPKGYVQIHSFERFICSEKVFGILGQVSDIAISGWRLNYSPTIDPYFKGFLLLGLENLLDRPNDISYGEIIGKVIFFDISETKPIKEKTREKKHEIRETLEALEKFLSSIS